MRLSIELVAITIVIMVVAVVVIAIFGGGIVQIRTLTDAKNHCITLGKGSCKVTGNLPPTWELETITYGDNKNPQSCKDLTGYNDCSALGS